jgi:outer membrane protein assembly factor BamB
VRPQLLTCAIALLLMPIAPATSDWRSFKGGPRASGVDAGAAATTWDARTSVNIRWKAAIPGIGHSSPIVSGDRIFVTTAVPAGTSTYPVGLADGPELLTPASDTQSYSWQVLAFDTGSGKQVWQRTLHEGPARAPRHTKNSFASPTPATDGRALIVYFGSEGLYRLDFNGELKWKRDLGVLRTGFYLSPDVQWGVGSSPIIYKNLVILQVDTDSDAALHALELETGKPAWKAARADGQSWSTPAIYEGAPHDVLIANAPRQVRGYDPATGRELWNYRWGLDIVLSTPTVANGLIYTSSGKGNTQPILAVRPGARGDITLDDGQLQNEGIAWSSMRGGPIITSPLVYGDYLYALVDLGILRCFHARTGELVYQERLPDSFLSSPVAAGGKIYLTSETGNVYVVRAGPAYELLSVNEMGEPSVATPAFSGGVLYLRTLRHLYAVDDRGR